MGPPDFERGYRYCCQMIDRRKQEDRRTDLELPRRTESQTELPRRPRAYHSSLMP